MKNFSAQYGKHLNLLNQSARHSEQQQTNCTHSHSASNLHYIQLQTQTFQKQGFNFCQIIGNFAKSFIICAHKHKIYLVDQHAASQKSLYVRFVKEKNLLMGSYQGEGFQVQNIYKETLVEERESLRQLGWVYEIIDQGPIFMMVVLRSTPSIFNKKCKQQEFLQILQTRFSQSSTFSTYSNSSLSKTQKDTMASFACHNAFRVGDEISSDKMRGLVDSLYAMEGAFNCPHGRPVVVSLGEAVQFKAKEERQWRLM